MRVRSRWFVLSGALGGLVGFAVMELAARLIPGAGTRLGDILRMSLYFAGFGLAVGAALGMTEGAVLRKPGRLVYGLFMGMVLGAVGGFAGGAVGQVIYGLVPLKYASRSNADVAIVLDSSGSMRQLLFLGNDPHGERRKAAKHLVDRLSDADRVAIVDFDDTGKVFQPLTVLRSGAERRAARAAIDRIDDEGGTNLSAGLDAAIEELVRSPAEERRRFLIFLTDGEGAYDSSSAERAKQAGITIYTIGLGQQVAPEVLQSIAAETGGQYYPVEHASALTTLFEQIFTQNIDMASRAEGKPPKAQDAELLTSPILLLILRILSWAAMGLAIGLGQGVRENTHEDLRACGFGGLLGGAIGGALFNPLTEVVTMGAGLAGRALADVVVGACIGGSMRLVQEKLVEASGRETTKLLSILPRKAAPETWPASNAGHSSPQPRPAPAAPPPQPSPSFHPSLPTPTPPKMPAAAPASQPAAASPRPAAKERYLSDTPRGTRPPLSSFSLGQDRDQAMAKAYQAGYSLREIAEHFGVPASAVKRATSQQGI